MDIGIDVVGHVVTIAFFIFTNRALAKENSKGIAKLSKIISLQYRRLTQKIENIERRVSLLERRNIERRHLDETVEKIINQCDTALLIRMGDAADKINEQKRMQFNKDKNNNNSK